MEILLFILFLIALFWIAPIFVSMKLVENKGLPGGHIALAIFLGWIGVLITASFRPDYQALNEKKNFDTSIHSRPDGSVSPSTNMLSVHKVQQIETDIIDGKQVRDIMFDRDVSKSIVEKINQDETLVQKSHPISFPGDKYPLTQHLNM